MAIVWTTATVEPSRYEREICSARLDLLSRWGVTEQSFGTQLLSTYASIIEDATYIGLQSDRDEDLLAGFSEYYSWGTHGFASSPFADRFDLATIGPPHSVAHIRSIYLRQEYRRHFGLYVRLYAATARHAVDRGFTHTTLITWSGAEDVRSLYRRMNARMICAFDLPGFPPTLEAYVIDLHDLLAQRYATRIGLS